MNVAVKKWGNSLAIRIPKDIVHSLSIENNSLMEMQVNDGVLTCITRKEPDLKLLVSKITGENLHREIDISWNSGDEKW